MKKILVLGAGVSGLTTAFCLANAGFRVSVVARDFSPRLTSNVAGALWEWPPAVCGYHTDPVSLERSKEWCMTSYARFHDLAQDERTGVFLRDVIFFFRYPIQENPDAEAKMNELQQKVRGFRRDAAMIAEEGVSSAAGMVDAYSHVAPMVDTDTYMPWLQAQVAALDVEIAQATITEDLRTCQDGLLSHYGCDYIVNCTGLGAARIAGEDMYPLRGALVRIKNDGRSFPVISKAYCVSYDERTAEQNIVFIVPRGKDLVVLGALAEADEWDTSINLQNYPPIREMFRRCKEFLPILEGAELDPGEPVRVGLRPFRKGNVRLGWAPGTKIIHNYGHGGAGVTFSWGCADEVVTMLNAT